MSLVTSIQRGGSSNHETTSEEANGVYTDFVSQGVLGTIANTSGVAPATGAYAVNAQGTPDMTVAVTAGTAYVTATPSTQASQTFRVVNSASANVTIAANSSGSTKYDWIYLKLDATNLNNPNVAGDDAATLVASRSSSISSDDGTPPTYGILLAIVTVSNGAVTITNGNIKDSRTQASIGASTSDSTGWFNLGATPNTITALGNRSYTVVFNSNDLTDTVSAGMKLRLTRTVSAPTQCADLEASSSQYFSSASAGLAGMTFTDDFTLAGWINPESYTEGGIVTRTNTTTAGFDFRMKSTGQLQYIGITSSGNARNRTTYESVSLSKRTHVAVTVDHSAGSIIFYKDGVVIPHASSDSGTSNSITQGGDLNIGAIAGATFFDGKLAQVSVHNAVLSAAQVKAMMSQTIDSSSPSIVSGFTCNGSLLDVNTTNNNDLTANGGALMTNVDSPFGNYLGGTLDYAIITKTAFSTNTTLTVQVPEGCAIPTSGGVSAVAYSTQDTPYLFPRDKARWRLSTLFRTAVTPTSSATYVTMFSGAIKLSAPVGCWEIGQKCGGYYNVTTVTVNFALSPVALTGMTTTQGADQTKVIVRTLSPVNGVAYTTAGNISDGYNLTAVTDFIMYSLGATTSAGMDGTQTPAELFAEFNLL